jgi:Fur family ferric uptake transcriptional regulator
VGDSPALNAFKAFLRERNLPLTGQRLAIADVVLNADTHMSAEEVSHAVRSAGTLVGTATVYRTLDVLVESGLAVERDFDEGFRRFEPARDVPQHEHMVCTVCGSVVEFRDERLERMTTLHAEAHGYARQRHSLVIYGVCQSCQRGRRQR